MKILWQHNKEQPNNCGPSPAQRRPHWGYKCRQPASWGQPGSGRISEIMLKFYVLLTLLAAAAGYFIDLEGTEFPVDYGVPFPMLPLPVETSFFLLTRQNLQDPEDITVKDGEEFCSKYFDPHLPTIILTHGAWHSWQEPWVLDMAYTTLEAHPSNYVMVDWSRNSWESYMRQTVNVRIVGRNIATFINRLKKRFHMGPDKFHLVGNNFGAHASAHAGKLTSVALLTALDPTWPWFGEHEGLGLTVNDATCVQVIHTDGKESMGFGYIRPAGNVDIYVNKGYDMPECPPCDLTMEEVVCLNIPRIGPLTCGEIEGFPTAERCAQLMAHKHYTMESLKTEDYRCYCTHYQALNYYWKSIWQRNQFLAQHCDSVEDCRRGKARPCSEGGCMQVGHFINVTECAMGEPRQFYLDVQVDRFFPYWES